MARRKHLVQIVDDDAASQRVLRVMLEADGFRVVTSDICMGGELEATSRPPDAMIVGMGSARSQRHWSHQGNPSVVAPADFGSVSQQCRSAPELLARVRAALRFHARGGLPTGALELDNL